MNRLTGKFFCLCCYVTDNLLIVSGPTKLAGNKSAQAFLEAILIESDGVQLPGPDGPSDHIRLRSQKVVQLNELIPHRTRP